MHTADARRPSEGRLRETARSRAASLADLTPREAEVVALIAAHKSAKEIAEELNLAPGTVSGYVASARTKWRAADRNALARIYLSLAADPHPGAADPSDSGGQIRWGDKWSDLPPSTDPDLPTSAEFRLSDAATFRLPGMADPLAPKGLEALDARFGFAWRIAAIPLIALAIGMVMTFALVFAKELSDLF